MFIDVKNVILRFRVHAQIVQGTQKLSAMIGGVINNMKQDLSDDQVLVLFGIGDRFGEQLAIL